MHPVRLKNILTITTVLMTVFLYPCLAVASSEGGPQFVLADDNGTHARLTLATVDFYNQTHSLKINYQQAQQLLRGSAAEGVSTREMNHFYDPLRPVGLRSYGAGVNLTAVDWAINAGAQRLSGTGDYSWPTAVAAGKNKADEVGYVALGHVLHLLEDMIMPGHVRLPFEFDHDNYAQWLENQQPAIVWPSYSRQYCLDLTDCFTMLATYVNQHFGVGQSYLATWQATAPMAIGFGSRLLEIYFGQTGRPPQGEVGIGLKIVNAKPVVKTKQQPVRRVKSYKVYKVESPIAETTAYNQDVNKIDAAKIAAGIDLPVINNCRDVPTRCRGISTAAPAIGSVGQQKTASRQAVGASEPDKDNTTNPSTPSINSEQASSPQASSDYATSTTVASTTSTSCRDALQCVSTDSTPPTCQINNLPAQYQAVGLPISWLATPAGDYNYELQYQPDQVGWQPWLTTTNTTAQFDVVVNPQTTVAWRCRVMNGDWSPAVSSVYVPPAPKISGPVHDWPLDENTGTIAYDQAGHDDLPMPAKWINDGFSRGAIEQSWEPGQAINKIWAEPLSARELTVRLAWRATPSVDAYSNNHFFLFDATGKIIAGLMMSAHQIRYYYNADTADDWQLTFRKMPDDNQWHQVAAVFSSSTLNIYIDGSLIFTKSGDFSFNQPLTGWQLATDNAPTDVDEIRIWDRALSAEELSD